MKIIKRELSTIQPVFNTNVYDNKNYITNHNIINHNCVVDSDYEGEIHISLLNTGENVVKLKENEKIVQFILLTIPTTHLIKIHSREELYKDSNSKRGDGGFGSTN